MLWNNLPLIARLKSLFSLRSCDVILYIKTRKHFACGLKASLVCILANLHGGECCYRWIFCKFCLNNMINTLKLKQYNDFRNLINWKSLLLLNSYVLYSLKPFIYDLLLKRYPDKVLIWLDLHACKALKFLYSCIFII